MRSLQSEYSGRACAALIHEFESQGGREPPVRARNSGDSGDRRALHVLPPNVTRHNDGRLHAEHMYCPKSKGFYLKQLQTKSESYRTGLLFHLKGAHVGFEKWLEGVCKAYLPLARTHFDHIEGPDLDQALCTIAYFVARTLGGTFLRCAMLVCKFICTRIYTGICTHIRTNICTIACTDIVHIFYNLNVLCSV